MKENHRTVHLGIIELPQELLLKFLQYPDGIIRAIDIPPDRADIIRIQLEHPEMPEAISGYHIPSVSPEYITYADCLGHKVTIRELKHG